MIQVIVSVADFDSDHWNTWAEWYNTMAEAERVSADYNANGLYAQVLA